MMGFAQPANFLSNPQASCTTLHVPLVVSCSTVSALTAGMTGGGGNGGSGSSSTALLNVFFLICFLCCFFASLLTLAKLMPLAFSLALALALAFGAPLLEADAGRSLMAAYLGWWHDRRRVSWGFRASRKGEEPGGFLHACSQLLPDLIRQLMLLLLLLPPCLILVSSLLP